MEITQKQKHIYDRRNEVFDQYNNRPEKSSVGALVKRLAKAYKVTEVTIYADIAAMK